MECDVDMGTDDSGVCTPPMHALSPASNIDSRRLLWYVLATTPIDSTVGSRPPNWAVSVFVWSRD